MLKGDVTVVGLNDDDDVSSYMEEAARLAAWCKCNNLSLNVEKTKEMITDFRKTDTIPPPLTIDGAAVERVRSAKFLGVHITDNLTWSLNTASLAKRPATVSALLTETKEGETLLSSPHHILQGDR